MGFQTNDTLFRTNANCFRTNANCFRTNANGFRTNAIWHGNAIDTFSDQCFGPMQWVFGPMAMPRARQWAIGLMVFRTNGSSDQWQWAVGPSTWHHYVYNACRSPKCMLNRRDAIGSRQDTSIIDHHTCTVHILHRVYTVFTSCTLYLLGSFGRW